MSVVLNAAGASHARSLISAGKVDKESSWSLSADDENALLGNDDWAGYSKWFLGADQSADPKTKAHWKYPFGKGGKVYRAALIAIRQRASQQDATGIYEAAGKLIDAIDGKGSAPARVRRDVAFELKSIDDEGIFSGYGSVYGNVDDYGDIMAKGVFAESLADWQSKNRMPAMLWQHNPREPIGAYKAIKESDNGLFVQGQLALKTQRGAEAYELMKMGALSGLSVGFMTRDDTRDAKTGVRTIKQADLWEISLVTFPANDEARVAAVKSIEEIEDLHGMELYLREVGISRSEAKAMVSRMLAIARREGAKSEDGVAAAVAALKRRRDVLKSA